MANVLFDLARECFLAGSTATTPYTISWANDNIKCVLVDHGVDTPLPSSDQYLSDIASGARVATSGNLASKTVSAGVADAADIVFSAVTGASCESVVLYKDTGTATTSPLIAFIDTATGLPVTPNGGDISLVFDNGASKIFKL